MKRKLLAAALCGISAISACAPPSVQPAQLSTAQQFELKTYVTQLEDPARSAKTKQEAAELLLSRPYPQAVAALKDFLEDPTNRAAQIAVAEAVAARGQGHDAFVAPLMKMLTSAEGSVRMPAARALATYKDPAVIERLIAKTGAGRDREIRLAAIAALERVMDKSSVDALVRLLRDGDAEVRAAAADALTRLTNIRTFGRDAAQWVAWWKANKDKPRTEWLADLADNLGREKVRLENENVQFRDRLARTLKLLYQTTPDVQREALLLGFLRDGLSDVRLVGAAIVNDTVAANQQVSPEVRSQVRLMLIDPDWRLRREAALLVASLADGETLQVLLARLKAENVSAVRVAVLTALGQLRDPKSLEALVADVASDDDQVATAAAAALARVAGRQPLGGAEKSSAAKALLDRYRIAARRGNGAALREALLTAMGAVGDKQCADAFRAALTDPAATVRLAGVNGLAGLGQTDATQALAALVKDSDRGVRQAVIVALARLDGDEYLSLILARTDPAVEPDPAVRQQAWNVAMDVLSGAESATLWTVVQLLGKRGDAAQQLKVLQMLVEAMKQENSPRLGEGLRQYGAALLKAGRAAEAATQLAEAVSQLKARQSKDVPDAWLEWFDAMLAAENPAALKALAEQEEDLFARAFERFLAKLESAARENKWSTVVLLSNSAAEPLAPRLTETQRADLDKRLAHGRAELAKVEADRVHKLVGQLQAADESARKTAAAQLTAMGDRATAPLLVELRAAVTAERAEAEKAIVAVLKVVAPKLTGYDPAADKDERLKRIDQWTQGAP